MWTPRSDFSMPAPTTGRLEASTVPNSTAYAYYSRPAALSTLALRATKPSAEEERGVLVYSARELVAFLEAERLNPTPNFKQHFLAMLRRLTCLAERTVQNQRQRQLEAVLDSFPTPKGVHAFPTANEHLFESLKKAMNVPK